MRDPNSTLPPTPKASSRRIFWLGTLLLAFNAFFGTYAYIVTQCLTWTQTSLLRGPLVLLFPLVLVNLLILKVARRFALTQSELLLLYSMLCMGTCAGGYGFVQILINNITSPFQFATESNGWKTKLWPHIPEWLAPRDPAVISGFYRGSTSLYAPHILKGWAIPILAWSLFIFTIFWTSMCIVSLFRRAWVEEERLTFPLVPLPLQMTEEGGATPFWKNRWMWAGFVVAGLAESMNYLAFLYPSLPSLPIKPVGVNMLDTYLTVFPWNQAGMLRLAFYPFVIGIAYLLPLDVAFSCWSVYLMVKAANVGVAMLGLADSGGGGSTANRAPYFREQGVGAFFGIALFAIWTARRTLAKAWQEMRRPGPSDTNELMSSRMAIVGVGLGVLFLLGFLIATGLQVAVAGVFLVAYLCFSLALARIVSEAGVGWAFAPSWSTTAFTTDVFGAHNLNARNLTLLQGYTNWSTDMRDNPMPHQAMSLKLGQTSSLTARQFLWPLVWAIAFGIFCAFWAHLHIYYTYGAASAKVRPALMNSASAPFAKAANLLSLPTKQDTAGMTAAVVGLLITAALGYLRQRFTGWPIHPLGYAIATTQSMDYMWFPFFLAWFLKSLVLRYGGVKMYRLTLPLFLGLILGDYVVPALWGVYGMLTGTQQYMSFPH